MRALVDVLHPLGPIGATMAALAAWALSWFIAAAWSRRTVARPGGAQAMAHHIPTLLGAALLFARLPAHHPWRLPPPIGWLLFTDSVAGFAFAWWARLWLGSLWSGTVTRKADHHVVDTGPYRLVRHPIYTGLVASGFCLALEIGSLRAILGAGSIAIGWWMKARVEERFLTEELGAAYEAYRKRTAMLVPFLKGRG